MKAVLITILVVIILIFSYNKYSDYERFSLENYEYNTVDTSEKMDKATVMLYHQKVAQLNGFIITTWSANSIDVRNPDDDDEQTLAARAQYDKILGEVTYLESKLQKTADDDNASAVKLKKKERHDRIKELFTSTPNNALRIGSSGALVFELQKLLNLNGSNIPQDGNFQRVTFESLKSFEEANTLFPDGKLDMLTLEYLLEK